MLKSVNLCMFYCPKLVFLVDEHKEDIQAAPLTLQHLFGVSWLGKCKPGPSRQKVDTEPFRRSPLINNNL